MSVVHIKSPYEDHIQKHEVSFYAGYYAGNRGQAGVGPQGAPMVGLGYSLHLGGPANLYVRTAYAFSERTEMNPYRAEGQQVVGTVSSPILMVDVGLLMALPGEKSWNHLVPYAGIAFGVGFGGTSPDSGGYSVGNNFYIAFGAGTKYVLKGPWSLRVDLWDYLWQLKYPSTYFGAVVGVPPLLPVNAPDKEFVSNGIFTVGVVYTLAR